MQRSIKGGFASPTHGSQTTIQPPYVIQWQLPEDVQIRKTALGHKVVLPVISGDPSDQPTVPDSLNIPTSNLPQEPISEALGETTVTKLYNIEDSRPQLHEPQGTVSLAPDGKWRVDGEKRLQGYNVLMLYYRNLRSCGTPVSPSLLAAWSTCQDLWGAANSPRPTVLDYNGSRPRHLATLCGPNSTKRERHSSESKWYN